MSRLHYLVPLICFVLVTGCSSAPEKPVEKPSPAKVAPASAESLISKAQQSQEPERSALLLKAARQLASQGQVQRAVEALKPISFNQLAVKDREHYILLGTQLSLQQGNADQALNLLGLSKPPLFQQAPLESQQQLSELRASAYELKGDYLLSAMERVYAAGLYSEDAYWRNHELVWQALRRVPTAELQHAFNEAAQGELKGWLDLALKVRMSGVGLNDQVQLLRSWQQEWPQHPAAKRLPEELQMLANLRQERPQRIALTLPMTGSLAAAGAAIRDGFLAAYYADPLREERNIEIQIYDTNAYSDYLELYRTFDPSNVDMVVGPLEKSAVSQLEYATNPAIPVLALNYTDTPPMGDKPIYQFGLAIEDEIAQAAQQAWNNGHRNAAIIVPESAWGQRAQQSFINEWQKLGGTVLKTAQLAPDSNYSAVIKDFLAIEESQQRARELSQLIGENVKADPRRRRDIDAIFLAASPIVARQVKPLLAFHYGGDIPVYATSQVYTGQINPEKDQDLNGILFVDLPWVLREDTPLKQQLLEVWPDQAYDRLYALGVDAYRVAPRLDMMQQFSDSSLQGMTGTLTLNSNHQLRRKLDWAMFRRGRPTAADIDQIK